MRSLSGTALGLTIGLTFSASLIGAAAGTLGFFWPGVAKAEGRIAFVPAIVVGLVLAVALASRAFPVESADETHPTQSERIYFLIALLVLIGLVTVVAGIIAAGKYAPTSLPQCHWALTSDHGLNQCASHVRWVRAAAGNAQVGIGFGTGVSAILSGVLIRARRRHLART